MLVGYGLKDTIDNRRIFAKGAGMTLTAIKKLIKDAPQNERSQIRKEYRNQGLLGGKAVKLAATRRHKLW